MTKPSNSIDWQELDRLVDGRLNDEEYRQLLCQIDADPTGWKQCAMAFLEHQALEKELSIFAADPGCQMMPLLGVENNSGNSGDSGNVGQPVEQLSDQPVEKVVPESTLQMSAGIIGWLSMALCIVGGVAMGFTLQSDFRDRLEASFPAGIEGQLNNVNNMMVRPAFEYGSSPLETSAVAAPAKKEPCNNSCGNKNSCRNRTNYHNHLSHLRDIDSPFGPDVDLDGSCPMYDSIENKD